MEKKITSKHIGFLHLTAIHNSEDPHKQITQVKFYINTENIWYMHEKQDFPYVHASLVLKDEKRVNVAETVDEIEEMINKLYNEGNG